MTSATEQPFDSKQFTSQTAELTRQLTSFAELLDKEALAIKNNDAEQLTDLTSQKQTLSNQLESLSDQLNQLLKPLSLTLQDFTDKARFSALPDEVQADTKALIQLIEECHDKNLANGMSIQILSNINQYALDLMSGKQAQDVKLYGASGEKTQNSDKNSLGKA